MRHQPCCMLSERDKVVLMSYFSSPLNELKHLIMDSYTLIPFKYTASCRNCKENSTIREKYHNKTYTGWDLTCILKNYQTSLWSWSKIGVFFIGEKPKVGIPLCLINLASVVEAKISGFPSCPPTAATACTKRDHHGLVSSVDVIKGWPQKSLFGPFSTILIKSKFVEY